MTANCFHCGLPVPVDMADKFKVKIQHNEQAMCCAGCQAVAQLIVDSGMESYYRFRTGMAPTGRTPVPEFLAQIRTYDIPAVQERFVTHDEDDISEVSIILEGITCAACIWLNEQYLSGLPGVIRVRINYASHRARIRWYHSRITLSEIIEAVSRIGYLAHPYDPQRQQAVLEQERQGLLRRLGIAGLLGMQVMILAVALYTGNWWGMEPRIEVFFEWASLLFTLPVLLYAARPFYSNALADLRRRSVGMDVPVSLGILTAFLASVWATVIQQGEVYFDSVVMFVFFLLVARYFELIARRRSSSVTDAMVHLVPAVATRITLENNRRTEHTIAVADLQYNDLIQVKAGQNIPVDGILEDGQSSIDESLLTGESLPVQRTVGDEVIAGSINMRNPILIRVKKAGQGTLLSTILDMLEQAQSERPAISRMADRIAGRFISGILIIAAIVSIYWWHQGVEDWIAITVAVLVVTCPCALSLATPVAMSAATGRLTQLGLLVVKGHSIETLARADHFIFDKTGTLTEGKMKLIDCIPLAAIDRQTCLGMAAAIEAASEHPIANAITTAAGGHKLPLAEKIENHPGRGMSGIIDGQHWYLGNREFIKQSAGLDSQAFETIRPAGHPSASEVWLARRGQLYALLLTGDQPRAGAAALIAKIRAMGRRISIISGDNEAAVKALAANLGIHTWRAQALPQDKLSAISDYQQQGEVVAMTGDGINDAPVLARAQISIAMGGGTQLASVNSDMILLSDRLEHLIDGLDIATRAMRIVKQNIAWALLYNIGTVPAAAMGYIPPWLAAIGMSASSLIVVGNSMRLLRK